MFSFHTVHEFSKKDYNAGSFRNSEALTISASDKIQSKCDFVAGGIINGKRQPVLYCFSLNKPPHHKVIKNIMLFHYGNIESNFKDVIFYFEDDDGNMVDFKAATIIFTPQLTKIQV